MMYGVPWDQVESSDDEAEGEMSQRDNMNDGTDYGNQGSQGIQEDMTQQEDGDLEVVGLTRRTSPSLRGHLKLGHTGHTAP